MLHNQLNPSTFAIEWQLAPQNGSSDTTTKEERREQVNPSQFVKKMRRYAAGNLKEISCTCCCA